MEFGAAKVTTDDEKVVTILVTAAKLVDVGAILLGTQQYRSYVDERDNEGMGDTVNDVDGTWTCCNLIYCSMC